MKQLAWTLSSILVVSLTVGEAPAQYLPGAPLVHQSAVQQSVAEASNDPIAFGKPLHYWLERLKERNPENIDIVFDALVEIGPDAAPAVPELTRIISEPFTPIEVSRNDRHQILAKLLDIHLRAGAIDSLGAIGEAAASAAHAVILWALAPRVVLGGAASGDRFVVDLVAMDVLERMRGAGTVAQFGPDASAAVQEILESPDGEKRKFAVAILGEGALPIAADLLNSKSCDDRILGFSMLTDMWPIVAREHLSALRPVLDCAARKLENSSQQLPAQRMREQLAP